MMLHEFSLVLFTYLSCACVNVCLFLFWFGFVLFHSIWCCWLKFCPYSFTLLKHHYKVTFVFLYFHLIWLRLFIPPVFLFSAGFCSIFLFHCCFYCMAIRQYMDTNFIGENALSNQNCTYLAGELAQRRIGLATHVYINWKTQWMNESTVDVYRSFPSQWI